MDLEHNENEELKVTPAEPEAAPEAEPETAPVPEAEPEEKPAEKKPGMSKGAKIAIFLAADPDSNVFKIVSFAWAGFGATFGPAMLCALFWKQSNRQGILAGLVAGGVMVFIWKFCVRPIGGAWDIYELLPAFVVATLVIVVVSLATKAPEESVVKAFEEVNAVK